MTKKNLFVGLLAMGFGISASALQNFMSSNAAMSAPVALAEGEEGDEGETPVLVSTTPEDGSFDLESLKEVVFTFNVPMGDDIYGELVSNGMDIKLPGEPVLSEDKLSITVTLPELKDGEYTLTLYDLVSAAEVEMPNNPKVVFSIGEDKSTAESKDIYTPDWTNLANGTFPKGWVSDDNGTIHEYVVMSDGSIGNYNWGGNISGGGCRAMTGYSGDFNGGAMYWRCMNGANELGELTYGAQVIKYKSEHGGSTEGMDPEIGLWLEPDRYHITFKCAAWCQNNEPKPDAVEGDPVSGQFYDPNYAENVDNYWKTLPSPIYNFELTDLQGEVFAQFHKIKAVPTVHRSQNIRVTNATVNEADFIVTEPGYYVLRFFSTQANAEFVMGGLKLITMPSKAAFYKGQLAEAMADAKEFYDLYNFDENSGETLSALAAELKKSEEAINGIVYHYPSEISAALERLLNLSLALEARAKNVESFSNDIATAELAIIDIEGTKFESAPGVRELIQAVEQYSTIDPKNLSDEELAEVALKVKDAAQTLSSIGANTGVLTKGIMKGIETFNKLEADVPGINTMAEDAVTDNRNVANAINSANKLRILDILANELIEGQIPAKYLTKVNEHEEIIDDEPTGNFVGDFEGIEVTGYIANPNFYRMLGKDGLPGWTIAPGAEEATLNIGYANTPSEGTPVLETRINIYGNADYDLSQIITNLPAGIYTLQFGTRTPELASKIYTNEIIYYNAQDENGTWDKFIYANNGSMLVAPFKGAGNGVLAPTYVEGIEVGDEGTITIGVREHYVSGKARAWDAAPEEASDARDFWTGTTHVGDAHLYLVAPLAGYDYKKALETSLAAANAAPVAVSAIYNTAGQKVSGLQKGVNIIKMSNNTVKKVIIK